VSKGILPDTICAAQKLKSATSSFSRAEIYGSTDWFGPSERLQRSHQQKPGHVGGNTPECNRLNGNDGTRKWTKRKLMVKLVGLDSFNQFAYIHASMFGVL
jgi:hypothetical protein